MTLSDLTYEQNRLRQRAVGRLCMAIAALDNDNTLNIAGAEDHAAIAATLLFDLKQELRNE